MDIEQSFQSTMCRLLLYSPFSFNMLVGMVQQPSESVETLGVRVKNGRITLCYNPKFFASLEESERTFVLIHEMMHVLLHHCTHRTSGDLRRARKENVAMDLAINCMIPEEVGVKMPRFKEDVGGKKKGEILGLLPSMFGFRDGLSYEQYLSLLDKQFPDDTIVLISVDGSSGDDGDGRLEISEKCPLGKSSSIVWMNPMEKVTMRTPSSMTMSAMWWKTSNETIIGDTWELTLSRW